MKVEGKTIPAPQNIKRREAFLLAHADKMPTKYVQAQLLRIAKIRVQKKLRWETPSLQSLTRTDRMEGTKKTFTPVKEGILSRIKKAFKK